MEEGRSFEQPDGGKIYAEYEEIIEEVLEWSKGQISANIFQEDDILRLRKIKAAIEWKMKQLESGNSGRIALGNVVSAVDRRIFLIEYKSGIDRKDTRGLLKKKAGKRL
jgi:hypothetical protein